jgi:hypothetical protein
VEGEVMPLKKPLIVDDKEMCINDANGDGVADVYLQVEAEQIVREVNAHDELLAACEAVYNALYGTELNNSAYDDDDVRKLNEAASVAFLAAADAIKKAKEPAQ